MIFLIMMMCLSLVGGTDVSVLEESTVELECKTSGANVFTIYDEVTRETLLLNRSSEKFNITSYDSGVASVFSANTTIIIYRLSFDVKLGQRFIISCGLNPIYYNNRSMFFIHILTEPDTELTKTTARNITLPRDHEFSFNKHLNLDEGYKCVFMDGVTHTDMFECNKVLVSTSTEDSGYYILYNTTITHRMHVNVMDYISGLSSTRVYKTTEGFKARCNLSGFLQNIFASNVYDLWRRVIEIHVV